MDIRTILTIPIVLILAAGIPTALAVHTPAYLYGFGLGKNAGLRGYYDLMNDCSNRPYLPTNVTGAIKHFTSLQQVNHCDSGSDDGWNQYCHIDLAKHPNAAAACPWISGLNTEILNTSGTLPWPKVTVNDYGLSRSSELFDGDIIYRIRLLDNSLQPMLEMSAQPEAY